MTVKEIKEILSEINRNQYIGYFQEMSRKLERYSDDTSVEKLIEDEIITSKFAYYWVSYVDSNIKNEMKQIVIKSKDPNYALKWAKDIGNKNEMKQIVIKAKNPEYAYHWARDIGNIEEMKQIIIESKDPAYAYHWAEDIGNREEMKQVILEARDLYWIIRWAENFGNKEEMKQAILEAKSPGYAYTWARDIGDRDEMKQIIIESKNPGSAYYWASNIRENLDEMAEIVLKYGNLDHIRNWNICLSHICYLSKKEQKRNNNIFACFNETSLFKVDLDKQVITLLSSNDSSNSKSDKLINLTDYVPEEIRTDISITYNISKIAPEHRRLLNKYIKEPNNFTFENLDTKQFLKYAPKAKLRFDLIIKNTKNLIGAKVTYDTSRMEDSKIIDKLIKDTKLLSQKILFCCNWLKQHDLYDYILCLNAADLYQLIKTINTRSHNFTTDNLIDTILSQKEKVKFEYKNTLLEIKMRQNEPITFTLIPKSYKPVQTNKRTIPPEIVLKLLDKLHLIDTIIYDIEQTRIRNS